MHTIAVSDLCLLNQNPVDNVKSMIAKGLNSIEVIMDGIYWNLSEEQLLELAAQIREAAQGKSVRFSVHPPAWDTNIAGENRYLTQAALLEYEKGVKFAGALNAEFVVIHPGFWGSPAFNRREAQHRSFEAIQRLYDAAKSAGTTLAIENVGYKGIALFNQVEWISFINQFPTDVKALLDTGHAFLEGWDIAEIIRDFDRLGALHIHDNNGTADQHMPMGEGNVKWASILDAIKNCPRNLTLTLEYRPGTALDVMCKHVHQFDQLIHK